MTSCKKVNHPGNDTARLRRAFLSAGALYHIEQQ